MEKFNYLYLSALTQKGLFEVALILIGAFLLLYLLMSTIFFLAVQILERRQIVEKIIKKAYFENQIRYEILQSMWSIVIFGLYGTLIVFLYRIEFLSIGFNGGLFILWDLAILIVWNEVHFFIGHRLMHTKVLVKFHRTHHKSVVVTPFSTYSFHPLESIIMGTVMIIPLVFYPFQIWSMILFPIYHLFFNTIGHTNARFSKQSKMQSTISSRHNLHHTKFSVNYGFVSTLTDRIAGIFKLKK